MKLLLPLFAVTLALVAGLPTSTIPYPTITLLVARDDSILVHWTKIKNVNTEDPIIGYIVKVWEFPDVIVYKYDIVDGEVVVTQEKTEAKVDLTNIPSGRPREINVAGGDITNAIIDNTRPNVLYHIRVLAYTKTQEGPLSPGSSIKLIKED
ncbi:uncharacterized protein LOC131847385 [Achroia grisella]|uniref:uncharacterized protein LOC131847385 n=1 Tax=Achroia grisella TaxID=688607 RepID=UPI0027D32989|nr:uncharacterized protein LOC131847385 [Achroia grisella]